MGETHISTFEGVPGVGDLCEVGTVLITENSNEDIQLSFEAHTTKYGHTLISGMQLTANASSDTSQIFS